MTGGAALLLAHMERMLIRWIGDMLFCACSFRKTVPTAWDMRKKNGGAEAPPG
jgi:hypothetical protein